MSTREVKNYPSSRLFEYSGQPWSCQRHSSNNWKLSRFKRSFCCYHFSGLCICLD